MTRGSDTIRCNCTAYPYPHRLWGGKCDRQTPGAPGDPPYEKIEPKCDCTTHCKGLSPEICRSIPEQS